MKRAYIIAALLVASAIVAGCGANSAPAVDPAAEPPTPPLLIAASPASGAAVGRDVSVVLEFDVPMDRDSLKRAVSFSPEVSFQVFVADNRAEVKPDSFLQQSTAYTFALAGGTALSTQGAALSSDWSLTFTTAGDPVTLTVPRLGYVNNIVEGPNEDEVTADIGNSAGHFPGLGRPGGGNFVLFAHASGQVDFPYNRLFDLVPGDELVLEYGGRIWTYRMTKGFVVNQTELWILDATAQPTITFFVCSAPDGRPSPTFHPEYRYVVRAELASSAN